LFFYENVTRIQPSPQHRITARYVTRIVQSRHSQLNFDSYLLSNAQNISALEGYNQVLVIINIY